MKEMPYKVDTTLSYQIVFSQSVALPDRLIVEQGNIYAKLQRGFWS